MSAQHEACQSRERSLIRENGELEAENDRLRMELHLANSERRLAMRALRILEYALTKKSETQNMQKITRFYADLKDSCLSQVSDCFSSIEQNVGEIDRQPSSSE